MIDYLCNAFTPDRREVWDDALGISSVGIHLDAGQYFVEPEVMVDRMDQLGLSRMLVCTTDVGPLPRLLNPNDRFEDVTSRWAETERLAGRWPDRFAALAAIDPTKGFAGVEEIRARLSQPWVVGLYIHTHSWDRRFDHPDYYPYYALCSELDVPVAMQAGVSGGMMASECGRPVTIDRAALYFPKTRFVLSHTGWPWVTEAIAMALKRPNVFIGTASYPPRHWDAELLRFLTGPGRKKVLFGTNYPMVGHARAIEEVGELGLSSEVELALMSENARRVFPRLG